jgi:hypothetical protein
MAAFGERPGFFAAVWFPFTASEEGVNVGESTLKRFLTLL